MFQRKHQTHFRAKKHKYIIKRWSRACYIYYIKLSFLPPPFLAHQISNQIAEIKKKIEIHYNIFFPPTLMDHTYKCIPGAEAQNCMYNQGEQSMY